MSEQGLLFQTGRPERLSRSEARARREDGMRRSRDNADKLVANWREYAIVGLERFIRQRGRDPFLAEQFLEWTRKNGVPQPHDGRAWGSVFSAARKLGLIEKAGVAPASTSNLSPKPLWRPR